MTSKDYYRDPNACVSAPIIQTPIDAMFQQGLLKSPVKVADYINTSYLPIACPA
jgi:sulfonate transport system substrate-binding protein